MSRALIVVMIAGCAVPGGEVDVDEGVDEGVAAATGLALVDDGEAGPVIDCAGRGLASLRASLVDDRGPLAGARVQLCTHAPDGTSACLRPVAADEAGDVVVDLPPRAQCLDELVARVLADDDHATLTCGVALDGDDTTAAFTAPIHVPRVDDEAAAAIAFSDSSYRSVAGAGSCVAAQAPPSTIRVWGVAPADDDASATATITGLPPSTTLQAHVLGGLACSINGALVPAGSFVEFASVDVDAAGEAIVSAIPCLTWFALSE